jgi:DNA-binding XRE family transcriptional regulator
MDAAGISGLRKEAGLSEEAMSKKVGLPLDVYLGLESGLKRPTRLQTLALERVALSLAVDRKNPAIAPSAVSRAALRLGIIVLEENRPE